MSDNTTWYDNNDTDYTRFDNDYNEYNEAGAIPPPIPEDVDKITESKSGIRWKKVAVGAGTGVLLGSAAAMLTGMKKADDQPHPQEEETADANPSDASTSTDESVLNNPSQIISDTDVATGMGHSHATTDSSHHSDVAQHTAQNTHAGGDDEIEVVHIEHTDNSNHIAQQTISDPIATDSEVEILGVVHDDNTGANIGAIAVDNQEVIFVDVDDDSIFDFMAADLNGNGEMDDNEIVDISSQHISVNDLGGITPMPGHDMPMDDLDSGINDVYEG